MEPLSDTSKSPTKKPVFIASPSVVDVHLPDNAFNPNHYAPGKSPSVPHLTEDTSKKARNELELLLQEDHYSSPENHLENSLNHDNSLYWLPRAAAKLGISKKYRWSDFEDESLRMNGGEDGAGKIDHNLALPTFWHVGDQVEAKLYERQQEEVLRERLGGRRDPFEAKEEDEEKNNEKKSQNLADQIFDEDLHALQTEFQIHPQTPPPLFGTNIRRSYRKADPVEAEFTRQIEELTKELHRTQKYVKSYEKTFHDLDRLEVKMQNLAETSKLRIQFMEQSLVPLYQESARHEVCRKNAEATVKCIDKALHHFDSVDKYAVVIKAGPVKNLTKYMETMDAVKESINYFCNTAVAQRDSKLDHLFREGRENLIKEFGDLLRLHSKPIPAVMIQDAINNSLHDPSASHEFSHFAESVHSDLQKLAKWFMANQTKRFGFYDFMDVYATFRAATVKESLDQFRLFFKEALASGDASFGGLLLTENSDVASVSRLSVGGVSAGRTSTGGEQFLTAGDGPEKKNFRARKLSKATPTRKNNNVIMGSGNKGDDGEGLFRMLRKRKTKAQLKRITSRQQGSDEDTYQKVESFMITTSAFLKIVESEVGLMFGIIDSAHCREVFDRIVRHIVDRFEVGGRELIDEILVHVVNGDFSAVLLLLQILEHLEDLKTLFDSALEGCKDETVRKWDTIVPNFRIAVLKTMESFLNSIKENNIRSVPPDGTIHEITSNSIAFFSNLVDFRPLFDALISDEEKKEGKTSAKQINFQGRNFAQYLNSVMSHLMSNLSTRAELYLDPTLKAIFLLNNVSYLLKYLKSSGVIDLMKEEHALVDQLIESKVDEYRSQYLEGWSPLVRLLTEAIAEGSPSKYKPGEIIVMKDRERNVVKDRCAIIAKDVQAIMHRQEKYSVPDAELRNELQNKNFGLLSPLYGTFYDRYVAIPFTKFHEKYLPYRPDEFERLLALLFSQSTLITTNLMVDQTVYVPNNRSSK